MQGGLTRQATVQVCKAVWGHLVHMDAWGGLEQEGCCQAESSSKDAAGHKEVQEAESHFEAGAHRQCRLITQLLQCATCMCLPEHVVLPKRCSLVLA